MAIKRSPGRPPHPDVLTPGEWRIVEAVRHGMGNAEIARRRGISADAVKYHLANALQKLGIASRAGCAPGTVCGATAISSHRSGRWTEP